MIYCADMAMLLAVMAIVTLQRTVNVCGKSVRSYGMANPKKQAGIARWIVMRLT